MDFGIGIASASDSWKAAQRAEELGFTHAWFYDTQMITADPFVAMAAAALKTSKIRLGTGVLVPSNRIAAVTANAFATLNGLAPGRIDATCAPVTMPAVSSVNGACSETTSLREKTSSSDAFSTPSAPASSRLTKGS